MRNPWYNYGSWLMPVLLLGMTLNPGLAQDSPGLMPRDSLRYPPRDSLENPPQSESTVTWNSAPPGTSALSAYRGSFSDGLPAGPWELQFGTFRAGGDAVYEAYNYRLPLDGELTRTQGEVAAGQLEGTWTQETTRITASRPGKQLFRSTFYFEAGTAMQTFEIWDSAAVLVGRFRRDGLAHDLWEAFTGDGDAEAWRFVDGRLEEISQTNRDKTQSWTIFPARAAEYELAQLDANYLRLVERWRVMEEGRDSTFQSPTARLLGLNDLRYDSITTMLRRLGADDLHAHFRVMVPVFPYTEDERESLIALGAGLEDLDAELGRLRVEMDTLESDRPFLEGILQRLETDALPPFRQVHQLYREGILVHLPRERYLARHWPDGSITTPAMARGGLALIAARVDSVRAALKRANAIDARRRSLLRQEGAIAAAAQRLDSLVNTQDNRRARRLGLLHLREVATAGLTAYQELSALEARETEAPRLYTCLIDLFGLGRALLALPDLQAEIAELYTDRVWNNFTSTVMEETVKKRLLGAYEDELVPYFQRWARAEVTCENADELRTLIEEVHAILRDLRYQDTKDLEQRLRSADGPRPIIELLYASSEL